MNSLNYLRSILFTLGLEEVKTLEKFILLNNDSKSAQNSKSLQLVQLILNEEHFSASDIQRTLYNKLNYSAFNKLVNRLKEKTLEVILLDANIKRAGFSERSRTIFELRMKMMQIEVLILKGMRDKIVDELNLTIKKANEFEVYDVLIQALYSKQRFQGLDMGVAKAEKLKDSIRRAELKWTSLNYSQSKFNELISKISSSSSSESYKVDLNIGLKSLEVEYNKTQAPTIGYYYYLLLVEKFQNEQNYAGAGKHLNKLNNLIENNRSVYSKYRLGSTALNIANNYIFLKDLNASAENLILAKEYFANQPANLAILNEIELYNLFYKGELDEARQSLNSLVKYTRSLNTPLLLDKRLYFLACLDYINQDFTKCLETILQCHELDKDKEGWNILKRIMMTLFRIETEEYESAELKLSNLDKFIKRILKTKNIRPRYLLIVRILRKLINENFDYVQVYGSRSKYFELLESDDHQYKWEIKSAELIIFEDWFKAKMKKTPYNHFAIMKNKFKRSA